MDVEPGEDGVYTLTAVGEVQGERQALEVVVQVVEGGIFNNAVFAGNSSDDPLYQLEFGGMGVEADQVVGDVYSGCDVMMAGESLVDGMIRAGGVVIGAVGETDVDQPLPDLAAMDYANTADFDVAALFEDATLETSDAGGEAWQMPEDSPAHIFRKNPSDRADEIAGTIKDDYFLEDPYEEVAEDLEQDGSEPYAITLSGLPSEPGPNGDEKVYFIDGNLWVHSLQTYSFQFAKSTGDGIQVTFVAKGNIYFSDNLFYEKADKDGVAFIAMKDPAVPSSGNVFLGDPEFGTLQHMDAFLYGENDFYDTNLDADGSAIVTLNGIMSAGNQVKIERDFLVPLGGDDDEEEDEDDDKGKGKKDEDDEGDEGDEGDDDGDGFVIKHSRLEVNLDTRIADGELSLPGLPPAAGVHEKNYLRLSWNRIALP